MPSLPNRWCCRRNHTSGISAATATSREKRKLLAPYEKLRCNTVDIAIDGVIMLDGLDDKGIVRAQHTTDGDRGNVFQLVSLRRNDLGLHIGDVHARKIEQRADCEVSAICVIVSGESQLKPVSEPLLDSDIEVVACHRSGVDNVETYHGLAKLVVRSGHHLGPRLKEDSRLAIHVKSLTKMQHHTEKEPGGTMLEACPPGAKEGQVSEHR
jgi:hypothetical protein